MVKIESADAQVQLDQVLREESVALKELKELEAKTRVRLAELKALQQLKKEATHRLQEETEEAYEEEIKHHEEERRQQEELESIDELVEDVQVVRTQSANPNYQNQDTQPLYNLQNTDRIAVASDNRTLDDLYSIGDKKILTSEDTKKFFALANDVVVSNAYEVRSNIVADKVTTAYQTLKNILDQRPDIVNQYKTENSNSPVSQFIASLKKSPVTDYKN